VAFFLPDEVDFFPHPLLCDPDGLLAFGPEVTARRLLLSYQFGIFPWNGPDDPTLWWYTHPRLILRPAEVKVSKSMRKYFSQEILRVTFDQAFDRVIRRCRNVNREGQESTWITDNIEDTFIELHHHGYAHSVEVWQEDKLVGGLYGMALGKIFCGESMFADVSNASKFALIHLCRYLEKKDFWLIDCQQATTHLQSMGGKLVTKVDFYKYLKKNALISTVNNKWIG
jgi:leucyl/phenylalanyl-tRNA---protein transferase